VNDRGALQRRRGPGGVTGAVAAVVLVLGLVASCATGKRHRGLRRLARGTPAATTGNTTTATPPATTGNGATTPGGTSAMADPAGSPDDEPVLKIREADARLTLTAPAGVAGAEVPVELRARRTYADGVRGPGVVLVPGAGDVSRDGTRSGDGVVAYRAPVDVTRRWAEVLASRGAVAFAWDKRTCGQNDAPGCRTNPQGDVDAQGPVALARDVDAACAAVRADPAFDGRLVLIAHGQGTQVALSSSCAASANAIVLLSPIPRAVDEVIVAALEDRHAATQRAAKEEPAPAAKTRLLDEAARLKNLAGSRTASFASMKSGRFAPDARVDGATLAFWTGWMDLTARTRALVEPHKERVIVVVGQADRQLSTADRQAAATLPAHAVLSVDADHHLLVDGELPPTVTEPVLLAIDALLVPPDT
jgi:hypothetical protein